MTAGPYPTKQMHEALKARVATLETAPGSGGSAQAADLHIGLPSLGSPTAPPQDLYGLYLRWVRRSVVVAGFRLAGSVPAAVISGVSLQRGPYGPEAVSTLNGTLTLTRREVTLGGQTFTDFVFGEAFTATDTKLNISFADAYAYPVSAQAELELEGVSNPDGNGFPYLAILSDRTPELPLVPAPFQAGDPLLCRTEVVWPASGAPYLHVVKGATEDGGEVAHFHLPLTPGLPQ